MKQQSVVSLKVGDRFVRFAERHLATPPVYTVQRIAPHGFTIFLFTDRGRIRANAAGSVLVVA